MIGFTVAALCAVTSLICAVLLFRGYARSRARLLFWSAACFSGLFLNNVLLLLDQRVSQDLSVIRSIPALIGVAALLYGLVWERER
ncbi:MAG TPA: DUF5985 family protein [Gemmatimonadaceae bacterium]|nr:DUF5985 family protein [Gemmatimonadaceae bacterium]